MSSAAIKLPRGGLLRLGGELLRDFAVFAGQRGAAAAVFIFLGALLEGVSLALLVPLIAVVTNSGNSFGAFGSAVSALAARAGAVTPFEKLAMLVACFAAVLIARAVVIAIRDAKVAALQIGFAEAQRLRVAQALAAAPWDKIVRLRHARVTQLISGDIQRVGMLVAIVLRTSVAAVMLVAQAALALLLAPAPAAIAILLPLAFALMPLVRRAYRFGTVMTQENLSLLNSAAQFLGGLKFAISQQLQMGFIVEFRQTLQEIARRQLMFMRQQSRGRIAFTTLAGLAACLLVLVGFGYFELPAPTLIVLLIVVARMSGPAQQIRQNAEMFAHSLPAYRAVTELERDLAGGPLPPESTAPTPFPEGPIVFERVTFLHTAEGDGAPRGLRDVTLTIAPGSFVGVTGPSGAGKTTFADLVAGLFPPQQGSVRVAGLPLQNAVLAAWRGAIAYVPQDAFLFHDSVRRNLSWVAPEAGEDAIWRALALAGADDLVRRMESGLDTVVGERGALVSGGERQRLAIARAVLRQPRVLEEGGCRFVDV